MKQSSSLKNIFNTCQDILQTVKNIHEEKFSHDEEDVLHAESKNITT